MSSSHYFHFFYLNNARMPRLLKGEDELQNKINNIFSITNY